MGGSGRNYAFPPAAILGKVVKLQDSPYKKIILIFCSRVAQHALVLESSGHVQPNPTEPAQSAQPVDTALQSDPSQKSDKSKSLCMAPRASAIKEQGFSEAVPTRIKAAQRGSTRSVYEAKWTIFMSSLCGVGVHVRVRVNNFSKTTRPRDMLFFKRYLIYLG